MISFLLNQTLREEREISPNLTILNYLREHAGKTGTKEGCGSGDCGACTVVLGETIDGVLQYRSVNACLTFISELHGKQLITVEDLKDGNNLHPVQKAMVDYHGSQCGYCTPGFIMSIFALTKNKPHADQEDVLEALAGNLCRCTGYRPIIDASLSLSQENSIRDHFSEYEKETIARLNAITTEEIAHNADNKSVFIPTHSDELADILLTHPDARIVAGGTDLALEVTQFHHEINKLVSISQVNDIKTIIETDSHIEIGANVPLTDAYGTLSSQYPAFSNLLHRFASLQVRNKGTLGGNIANASPIADGTPLLLALGASVILRCGDQCRELPLDQYFIEYKVTAQQKSEFIQTIRIPKLNKSQEFYAYKLSKRLDDDISAVCGAFCLTLEKTGDIDVIKNARIAFGGMAAIPARALHCESALNDQPLSLETIQRAMKALDDDFQPISDFRASKEYRAETAANMLYRLYTEIIYTGRKGAAIETRVTSYVS